jgi:DNA-binding CsgD family transcriptional regulator
MSYAKRSDLSPVSLDTREQAILELCAAGLDASEISVRLQIGRREISALCASVAAKLAVRIASAHPFRIHEVVLDRSLDFEEL